MNHVELDKCKNCGEPIYLYIKGTGTWLHEFTSERWCKRQVAEPRTKQ